MQKNIFKKISLDHINIYEQDKYLCIRWSSAYFLNVFLISRYCSKLCKKEELNIPIKYAFNPYSGTKIKIIKVRSPMASKWYKKEEVIRFSPFKMLPIVEERYKKGHKRHNLRIMSPVSILWNTNSPRKVPVR